MLLNKIDISVIICCYNSETRIVPTLEHLSKQILGPLRCEIILVDNNCSDRTIELVKKTWDSLGNPFDLKVIEEKESGLSFARKAGVFAAQGEIIVFCDDDNWLENNYVLVSYEVMKSNTSIGILTGESRAVSDIEIPTWFYTFYSNYACGTPSLFDGDITSRLWVWGAGMVLRRKELMSLYQEYTHLTNDRTKDSLESGGDVEICFWHVLNRKLIWYDSRLRLKHFMPSARLTKDKAQNQFNAQQKSSKKLSSLYKHASMFYNFNIGKLNYKKLVLNVIKLRFRESIRDFYYYTIFTLKHFK